MATTSSPTAVQRVAVLLGREPEERFSIHRGYIDGVVAAGALPVLLVPGPAGADEAVLAAVAECDAVLVTGGHDVDPTLYGEADGGLVKGIDADRDRLEVEVVRRTVASGRRLLGICRGIQILNVALGGSLHQDLVTDGLDQHSVEDRPHEPVHDLEVVPGSLIEGLLAGRTKVNSLHHQGVKVLGEGLEATAFAPDGLIEAFEAPGVLGIQWHPERMLGFDDVFHAPFRWLVGSGS
ncbi:MAG: gamma-glutamyl-gamma-aminobutyrate hydrolase family protein [Acidimicrobiales bacterium]|jgi:putative glutamine amidotransferase|nr:gamma-glutamyl-gamma-aminobutyrate hydrolase family protein [Acidimicrobiales bacterium]